MSSSSTPFRSAASPPTPGAVGATEREANEAAVKSRAVRPSGMPRAARQAPRGVVVEPDEGRVVVASGGGGPVIGPPGPSEVAPRPQDRLVGGRLVVAPVVHHHHVGVVGLAPQVVAKGVGRLLLPEHGDDHQDVSGPVARLRHQPAGPAVSSVRISIVDENLPGRFHCGRSHDSRFHGGDVTGSGRERHAGARRGVSPPALATAAMPSAHLRRRWRRQQSLSQRDTRTSQPRSGQRRPSSHRSFA